MAHWRDRYNRGDRVGVWTEMTSLGPDLPADDMPEAFVVVRETMRRVRKNVARLAELLPAIGYIFDADGPVFEPPPANIELQLDGLEARVGRLPLALRSWYEEVGRVNFVGRHPQWGYEYHDPLVVDAPVDFVLSEYCGSHSPGEDAPAGAEANLTPGRGRRNLSHLNSRRSRASYFQSERRSRLPGKERTALDLRRRGRSVPSRTRTGIVGRVRRR
ncbi:MAG: hypothetical protein AB1673_08395 [Actinomycetota bacterium]